jgi:hypothetical protein
MRLTAGRSNTRRVAAGLIDIGSSGRSVHGPEEGGRDNVDVGIPGERKMIMLVHDVATWSASCRALVDQAPGVEESKKETPSLRRGPAAAGRFADARGRAPCSHAPTILNPPATALRIILF